MFKVKLLNGEKIIKKGDEGDKLYVIEKGEVEVLVKNEIVKKIGEGGSFGEMEMIYGKKREENVREKKDVKMWGIERD
jgi:CRP-like cAMP-binding protein